MTQNHETQKHNEADIGLEYENEFPALIVLFKGVIHSQNSALQMSQGKMKTKKLCTQVEHFAVKRPSDRDSSAELRFIMQEKFN